MLSEFKLIRKELNLEHFPNSSHFEYHVDGVNGKDIIDDKYHYMNLLNRMNLWDGLMRDWIRKTWNVAHKF